jgi:hypothetical protein
MKEITIQLSDPIHSRCMRRASETGQDLNNVINAAIIYYMDMVVAQQRRHSVLEIEPAGIGGTILKPWTSRAELLEDFFDHEE